MSSRTTITIKCLIIISFDTFMNRPTCPLFENLTIYIYPCKSYNFKISFLHFSGVFFHRKYDITEVCNILLSTSSGYGPAGPMDIC